LRGIGRFYTVATSAPRMFGPEFGAPLLRLGWASFLRPAAMADLFTAKRMHLFAGDWRLIDTAPLDQDVTLSDGEPYRIPYPCKRTAGAGWVKCIRK
jgi:hypothetical protein